MGHSSMDPAFHELRPWNEGRYFGAKRALKQQIWVIRFWLDPDASQYSPNRREQHCRKRWSRGQILGFPKPIEADRSCKLILALGDQSRGQSPFNGALEQYLIEQGYTLAGPLVVDQPGDNDTLLTLPLQLPMGALWSKNR